MGDYNRYEGRYNRRTAPMATRSGRPWTSAEELRVLKAWCRGLPSPELRIHAAQTIGRTYVACDKRHTYLHHLRNDDCEVARKVGR